jgi:uncharacterized membrane protein
MVWFLFLLVAYPLIIAFVISLGRGTAAFTEKNLLDLYRDGLKQIPIVGKLLSLGSNHSNFDSVSPKERSRKPPKPESMD